MADNFYNEEEVGKSLLAADEINGVLYHRTKMVVGADGTATDLQLSEDAFGRLRVSDTGNRLDVEFIYDKQDSFMDEITNNGTVTHIANTRDLTLALSDANNGSYATMRSHPVPYTPGNSQLCELTG